MFVCSPPKYWGDHDGRLQSSCPLPPDRTDLVWEAWRAGADGRVNRYRLPGFPTPRAAPRVEQKLTSLPGLNKGGNAKILGKQTGPCTGLAPQLSGWNGLLS